MKFHDVLVLNKSWAPVHIISWDKAMTLMVKEHAHPLDREFIAYTFDDWKEFTCRKESDDYQKIGTAHCKIVIPEIITLTFFNKLPQRDVKFSRQSVFTRDKDICQYCEKQFKRKDLTIDHIVPRSQGGKTTWDNVVAACIPCNGKKDNTTLEEMRKRYPSNKRKWSLKTKPHKPKWYSPVSQMEQRVHVCRSWEHFMKSIDTSKDDEELIL